MSGRADDWTDAFRPEARPLAFGELDEQQQFGIRRIIALVTNLAGGVSVNAPEEDGLPIPQSMPFLDSTRTSGTLLISGERGTGKTTLMLSLADALSARRGGASSRHRVPEDLRTQVASLRKRLIWLETLDMEPLSHSANLLGAVLARIEDAVGAYFPHTPDSAPRTSLLYPGYDYHNYQHEMLRLQTSVALSFDGNLSSRAGNLDPDNFAIEARRAERERLGINRRFATMLSTMSKALDGRYDIESPIFVLPVDDLDLNPGACLLLLELLRKVHSPHLLVIIAANHRLLSMILELKYTGELARIAAPVEMGDKPFTTADSRMDGRRQVVNIQAEASDLAANALRKHLPPTQRVILGLIEPTQALGFALQGDSSPQLYELLGPVELKASFTELVLDDAYGLDTGAAPEPLMHPLVRSVVPHSADAIYTSRGLDRYSWLEVLRLPMRRLVDLYLGGAASSDEPLGQNRLRHLARDQMDRLRGTAYEVPSQVNALLTRGTTTSAGPVEIQTLAFNGWDVRIDGSKLHSADARLFVGSVDLLDDQEMAPRPLAVMRPVRATHFGGPWDGAVGIPGGPPGQSVTSITWPWVAHTTFWGYERALQWLDIVDRLWREIPGGSFGSWITVMTAQLFDAASMPLRLNEPAHGWACNWEELTDELRKLSPNNWLSRHWLVAVGLLCTPEMGLVDELTVDLVPEELRALVREGRNRRRKWLPDPVAKLVRTSVAPRRTGPRHPSRSTKA